MQPELRLLIIALSLVLWCFWLPSSHAHDDKNQHDHYGDNDEWVEICDKPECFYATKVAEGSQPGESLIVIFSRVQDCNVAAKINIDVSVSKSRVSIGQDVSIRVDAHDPDRPIRIDTCDKGWCKSRSIPISDRLKKLLANGQNLYLSVRPSNKRLFGGMVPLAGLKEKLCLK